MKKLNGLFLSVLLITAAGMLFAGGSRETADQKSAGIEVKILHCGG